MVGYIDELINKSIVKDVNEYKIVLNNNKLWVTNFVKILEYNKEKIRLKLKDNILIVEGVDMMIEVLDKKEIILSGYFNGIYLDIFYKGKNNEKTTSV